MWTLECDNPTLGLPRIWLRPGKKYLLGRTEDNRRKGEFRIDDKSVSRKHITLDVSPVKPGSGSHVHTRSELTLKDENTKFGTELDGLKVEKGEKRPLKNDEHIFKLGKTGHIFRVKWRPIVLTFSFSSKETKGGKDPLAEIRAKLEPLDIKTIIPYIAGTTTHVVQSKRNTAKGLQALVNAKYIVTNTYIDALVEATTSGNPLEEESFSLLEDDYDRNWPDPLRYLPAKSKEANVNERPAELFAPHVERGNIFEGYMFVFCDQVQFETLLQPITNAGGKAFKFKLQLGETRADEIVRFVKEVAGEKSMGELEDESAGKGVVVVRFRGGGKKEYDDWAISLGDQVAVALGQRMIEQSEFMDSILMNDPTVLRKPLQVDDEPTSTAFEANAAASQQQAELVKPEVSQPSGRTRGPIRRRFKGFDDGFETSNIPTATQNVSSGSLNDSRVSSARSQLNTQPAPNAESQMDSELPDSHHQDTQTPNPRKRRAPTPELEDNEVLMDNLLSAVGAMKRRKLEEKREAEAKGKSFNDSFSKPQTKEPTPPEKPKKGVDIKSAVRERRKAEDQAARQDEESLRSIEADMNIEEMKRLAVVEEMPLPPRSDRPTRHDANGTTPNDRWDDRWNGRKNFKKFRRHGEAANARRGHTVMIPLERFKQKDFGIGEEYWLDSSEKAKRKRKDKTQSQSQLVFSNARSQPVNDENEKENENEEIGLEGEETELKVPAELAREGDSPDTIDVQAPRTTRGMEHTQQGTKRAASPPTRAKPPPAKKQKVALGRGKDDSDSEDELKFRFRRRKR